MTTRAACGRSPSMSRNVWTSGGQRWGWKPAAAYDERIRRAYGPATDKETTA